MNDTKRTSLVVLSNGDWEIRTIKQLLKAVPSATLTFFELSDAGWQKARVHGADCYILIPEVRIELAFCRRVVTINQHLRICAVTRSEAFFEIMSEVCQTYHFNSSVQKIPEFAQSAVVIRRLGRQKKSMTPGLPKVITARSQERQNGTTPRQRKILALLTALLPGNYLKAADLGDEVGISSATVATDITDLRRRGYTISAKHGHGYGPPIVVPAANEDLTD